jgi:hypothetical protein
MDNTDFLRTTAAIRTLPFCLLTVNEKVSDSHCEVGKGRKNLYQYFFSTFSTLKTMLQPSRFFSINACHVWESVEVSECIITSYGEINDSGLSLFFSQSLFLCHLSEP